MSTSKELTHKWGDKRTVEWHGKATFSVQHVRLDQNFTGIFKPVKSGPGSLLDPGLGSYPFRVKSQP